MNLLIHKLPTEVEGMAINTDYKVSILFELLMQDKKVPKELKLMKALQMYYPNLQQITNVEKAIQNMMWFYKCGKYTTTANKEISGKNNNNQIYSYEYDDKYIYSAFLQQYKIDLQETKYMHWWKFKALFDGLNEETEIVKIMGYRSVNISQIKDIEKRNYYKKMKRLYGIPDMRSQEEKEEEFARSFL